jgi:hypothetical protein
MNWKRNLWKNCSVGVLAGIDIGGLRGDVLFWGDLIFEIYCDDFSDDEDLLVEKCLQSEGMCKLI